MTKQRTYVQVAPDTLLAADRADFTDVRLVQMRDGDTPLIYARWHGAPVAIRMRSGLAGGLSAAFYRGNLAEPGQDDMPDDDWDELFDTRLGDETTALTLAGAAFAAWGHEGATRYTGQPMPDEPRDGSTPAIPTDADNAPHDKWARELAQHLLNLGATAAPDALQRATALLEAALSEARATGIR